MLLGRSRGLFAAVDRRGLLEIFNVAMVAGARAQNVADLFGQGSSQAAALAAAVHGGWGIQLTCNEPMFAALPPGLIVPIPADRSL